MNQPENDWRSRAFEQFYIRNKTEFTIIIKKGHKNRLGIFNDPVFPISERITSSSCRWEAIHQSCRSMDFKTRGWRDLVNHETANWFSTLYSQNLAEWNLPARVRWLNVIVSSCSKHIYHLFPISLCWHLGIWVTFVKCSERQTKSTRRRRKKKSVVRLWRLLDCYEEIIKEYIWSMPNVKSNRASALM